jgi:transposase-like protein
MCNDLYGVGVSTGASAITDQLLPKLKAWQKRLLKSLYPIVIKFWRAKWHNLFYCFKYPDM